jgi:hypothetical protein
LGRWSGCAHHRDCDRLFARALRRVTPRSGGILAEHLAGMRLADSPRLNIGRRTKNGASSSKSAAG